MGSGEPHDYQRNEDISGDLNTVLYLKSQLKCGHHLPIESYKQMTLVTPKHRQMIWKILKSSYELFTLQLTLFGKQFYGLFIYLFALL